MYYVQSQVIDSIHNFCFPLDNTQGKYTLSVLLWFALWFGYGLVKPLLL